MTTTRETLRSLNIFNTHDVLRRFAVRGKTDLMVSFSGADGARSMRCHKSVISSLSHKTSPDAAWYDYGCKAFVGGRNESLPKAIAWASERYGIAVSDWVPSPAGVGDYIPRVVREAALKAAKAAGKP